VFFWGSSFRATAIGVHHTPAIMLAMLRTAPVGVLILLLPLLGKPFLRGRMLGMSAVTGFLSVGFLYAALSISTDLAGPGNASVLINASPFFVLLLGFLFLSERISRLALLGLVGGFAGVVTMVSSQLGGHVSTSRLIGGMALALAGSVSWATCILWVKAKAERDARLDLIQLTLHQFAFGSVPLVIIAFLWKGTAGTDWGSSELWGTVAWLVIGAGAIATITFFLALRRLSATSTASSQFLVPAVAVLIEVGRGSSPSTVALLGMIVAILGVAICVLGDTIAGSLQPGLRPRDDSGAG
jgi:drug/metabolite transporter (DMT)-like permease